jgi:hypothetical protein
VLAVVYLIFNEGYSAGAGDRLVRAELCAEAIRLGRLLAELMPDEPEVMGLLALMLLAESRRGARTSPGGALVVLADQDRSRWDRDLVAEGQAIVRACLTRGHPGPYQIQAAINAVHSDAATAADTDWSQILRLYDQLMALAPTPVVALNRAVALAEVEGPQAGLSAVETSRSTATASTTQSAPICCAASGAPPRRRRSTRRRSARRQRGRAGLPGAPAPGGRGRRMSTSLGVRPRRNGAQGRGAARRPIVRRRRSGSAYQTTAKASTVTTPITATAQPPNMTSAMSSITALMAKAMNASPPSASRLAVSTMYSFWRIRNRSR